MENTYFTKIGHRILTAETQRMQSSIFLFGGPKVPGTGEVPSINKPYGRPGVYPKESSFWVLVK